MADYTQMSGGTGQLIHPSIAVPRFTPQIRHDGRVTTPEWMISIDDILTSTITDHDTQAELFGFYAQSSRQTTGNTANQLFTTAAVQHSDVYIIIPNGDFAATLENKMNTGATIEAITIQRLGNMSVVNMVLQEIKFEKCKFQTFQQIGDELQISFRPQKRTNTIFKFDQTGQPVGQSASTFDFTTAATE